MNTILFEQATIKGIQLKNRFVRSATAEGMATSDGQPTRRLKDLYCKLAENEVSLIITGAVLVAVGKNNTKKEGIPQMPFLAIDEDRFINNWRKVTNAVHELGSKIAMQINHPGRQDFQSSKPIAPSAVPIKYTDIVPREMTLHEINKMIEKFAQSCHRIKESGFDAVEFLGAHGHLINNFLSPHTNIRTDIFGGNTENRTRFLVEIIKRTRELVGKEYPLLIKMNFDDFVDGGLNIDEAANIAKIIVQAGIDCIEVTGGTLSESPKNIMVKGIDTEEKEAYFQSYAKALKEHVSIPVILVGGHRTPGVMERLIEDDITDFVSMCRPFIREPGLIKRWRGGDPKKAKCISCNKCLMNIFKHPLRCYTEKPLENDQ